ncbi:uncharacterized protein LOC114544609 [Dendronephthya gigantea]|uniref:uncharacterized protein LOC114544609 n=1 Tax=Dendronephthya gigantea TaxID=151771 RepID=UPI00106964CF|nr:uncharacterized protein LOC114544609 [Dendronephthya gigantea]
MEENESGPEAELGTKIIQLQRAIEKSDQVLKTEKKRVILRHIECLKETISKVNKLRISVEATKIAAKIKSEEIDNWNQDIESKLEEADSRTDLLEEWLHYQDAEVEKRQLESKAIQEDIEREKRLKFELKLHEAKVKLQNEIKSPEVSASTGTGSESKVQAKLPKLHITKFNGTYADWPRFWSLFSETIHKTSVSPVNKFAYLRELLCEKASKAIEALPHTSEGYNRAIVILKDRFGKESEIVKTFVKEILDLPHLATANAKKIHEFYEKLVYCVQSLETLNRLDVINGTVPMVLDKLPAIRGDLVRNDSSWEQWNFVQFTEALRQWTRRNPVMEDDPLRKTDDQHRKRRPNFQTQQGKGEQLSGKKRSCVYCDKCDHRSSECESVNTADERKSMLARKKLCFNCTGPAHRASECRSTTTCKNCGKRHHTSICSEIKPAKPALSAHRDVDQQVIYPTVLVEIDGIQTHALLDTGAGSSYASATLIETLHKKPKRVELRRVDMMLTSKTTKVEIYSAKLTSVDGKFTTEIELSKVNKSQLMMITNPEFKSLCQKYDHLKEVEVNEDPKNRDQIPVHVVLGASEYATIKTRSAQKVGQPGQPVAERTLLGWTLMSSGKEDKDSPVLFAQSTSNDYEQLCSLDVLGLADKHENDQEAVYQEFKEQLERDEAGWYQTSLPWKGNHPSLPTNVTGSNKRLEHLVRKLKKNELYEDYNNIIQEQLQKGIVEPAPEIASGNEFYIPHKAVVKKEAESTKLRVVYDASARENESAPSLNDCLHPGPALQNQLWDILVKSRFHPILLTGDLVKAFLQIRIKQEERDSLRFHWREPNSDVIRIYRFTRALFGLTSSPFLLAGVLDQHLNSWKARYPKLVEEVQHGLYVDDLIAGGVTVEEVLEKKTKTTEVFENATFSIHKWHSNAKELEASEQVPSESEEMTYAKQQLGSGGKLLGLPWDRERDTFSIEFRVAEDCRTKRDVLSQIAKLYDPLGLVSPTMLVSKLLFRDICDAKVTWDAELPGPLLKRWKDWRNSLPREYTVPRSLTPHRIPVAEIELHSFGDASSQGVCAVVYAVTRQMDETTQGLVCSKSRIAKRNLTIPRLELIAGHMAVNIASNVEAALSNYQVKIHCWLDSTVALYWIQGKGDYRQFVANRVRKIQQHDQVTWHYVPTSQNPADLGSRGGTVEDNAMWKDGPPWLHNHGEWPADVTLEATAETRAEAKVKQEILTVVHTEEDEFDQLLDKFSLFKVLRIGAWVRRFVDNCRVNVNERRSDALQTEEIDGVRLWWIKRAQLSARRDVRFEADQLHLNIQLNGQEVLECRGRMSGKHPIYLPDNHSFTTSLVQRAHVTTLHGGVGMTMAEIRERYWIPRLRRLVKKIRSKCHGCRRFQAKAFEAPPPGKLPSTRTEGSTPFQVLGVDFAGPIKYRVKTNKEKKAYLALFACSLTRAVHMELVRSLETGEFIRCFKKFVARRGRPELVYSDNGTTFKAAAKWLETVRRDEKFNSYLAKLEIKWRFNLSRAPWWGGQFERLIGLFKRAFHKSIGNGTLEWSELEDVVLDIEVTLNNRPLGYVDEDIQQPVLTPNSMLQINPNSLPELEAHRIEDANLKRRAKFLKRCKQTMWNRWSREYIRSLRGQHRQTGQKCSDHPKVGDIVIVQEENQPRNRWKLAMVTRLISGRDNVTRGAVLKTGKGTLERPIQHLYPLELSCDREETQPLNPNAPEYHPRPRRAAAVEANKRIQEIANDED